MSSKNILDNYVTNTDDNVFAVTNLSGIVGAVMARYSRAETGLRETLLREFIKEDQLKLAKADKLIERVLIAYGDDSVGELEGAHLSFENISMLATKLIEHRRIGGSPIEQSTRYVRYDFRNPNDDFHFHIPSGLGEGAARSFFVTQMNQIFENYSTMWQKLMPFLEARKPMAEASYDLGAPDSRLSDMQTAKQRAAFERTYRNDLKTKACDILRAFLPLATKANVGLFGNGRFYQHLISKLLTSSLPEGNTLGEKALRELSKIIPHYVKRAKKLQYLTDNERAMAMLVRRYFSDLKPPAEPDVMLVDADHGYICEQLAATSPTPENLARATRREAHLNFLASLVYAHARGSFTQIRNRIKTFEPAVHEEIMDAYYGQRRHRRNRPERGIEYGYPYTFDLVTEWAVYKDLMRHRMATIQVQPLTTDLGFQYPPELEAAGLAAVARDTVDRAGQLYRELSRNHPAEREYAVLQGHRVRWLLGINDRALMHMLELRTAPQGHPNYRKTCRQLHRLAEGRYPERGRRMNFVNHEEIYWSRGDSEARIRVKEARLEAQATKDG